VKQRNAEEATARFLSLNVRSNMGLAARQPRFLQGCTLRLSSFASEVRNLSWLSAAQQFSE
jgi:hypothetical protein